MLRRTFLKAIGVATAAICLPVSVITERLAAKEPAEPAEFAEKKLPDAVCPCCGDLDITIDFEKGTMICHACEAEGTFGITISTHYWPELVD